MSPGSPYLDALPRNTHDPWYQRGVRNAALESLSLKSPLAHRSGALEPHRWTARGFVSGPGETTIHVRNHTVTVGAQASFASSDANPSAIEYLLAALAGDLLAAFTRQAVRQDIVVDAAEVLVSGHLNNPLMVAGVIGESGSPAFEAISCTLYVTTGAEEPALQKAWETAIATCPVIHTLQRAVSLDLQLQVML